MQSSEIGRMKWIYKFTGLVALPFSCLKGARESSIKEKTFLWHQIPYSDLVINVINWKC